MKVVALISGGKDSTFNMMQCLAAGHDIVALANLTPHNKSELDSYMYQSVGHEAIDFIAAAMDLPLYRQTTHGQSTQRGKIYEPTSNDEVEDLFQLLSQIKSDLTLEAVSVGAILSDYQRVRVENVCIRLGLVPLAYLWQRDQKELLNEMIKCEVDAVVIKVAALGLDPTKHLGRTLSSLQPHLHAMNEKYGLNVCGEGGEYETLTVDCPLFKSRIVIDDSEVILDSNDPIAPVGYLKLKKLSLETILSQHKQTVQDVCSIAMFVSDMSRYNELNQVYCETFTHPNPPSRACVQVPSSFPVILTALSWAQPPNSSGDSPVERHTMHVQSRSHWAPTNIGPYSQGVRVGELIHLAGQIGLVPGSLELVKGGIKAQCQLALRHVGRLLKAIDSNVNLRDVVQGICYVTDLGFVERARKLWEEKTNNAIVDYVVVTQLPKGALVEWHVWAHRHNNQFEYEETGKCVDGYSISIYRRWNYENDIAAVVCYVDNAEEVEFTEEIFVHTVEYAVQKLTQGQENDSTSIYSLNIFYPRMKIQRLEGCAEYLKQLAQTISLAYTFVPVAYVKSEHTYLSICGMRNQ
ncbi:diphthine--ammonia ligase [Asbolus verrucosus]|uniref:Diphthine--ammonia ligase n=1 Tax=Asbolus verrucosus TaxID=1661398 RepID=A0A482W2Q8_ASBVE|nr:diphthine--ammonia ligase [Asbolus verrucosus]